MTELISTMANRPTDWNGDPVPGAVASFFLSGTTTPQIVYQDDAETIPYGTTVNADSRGVLPAVYSSVALKLEVRDTFGTLLPGFPIDPVARSSLAGLVAEDINFTASVDVPVTNVQDAIDRVQENITGNLQLYGIGETGAVVILTSIDDATTASGWYRVNNTTLGTFPAGTTGVDFGVVQIIRQTSTRFVQVMYYAGSPKSVTRHYAAAFGTWHEPVLTPYPIGSIGQSPRVAAAGVVWGASGPPDVILQHQLASGTSGGGFTSGSDQIRPVNTEVRDVFNICTVASNQFTLAAGTYYIKALAQSFNIGLNQLILWNATDSAALARGDSNSILGVSDTNGVTLTAVFTIAAAKALEIRQRGANTQAGSGMGVPTSFGVETYLTVELWRV